MQVKEAIVLRFQQICRERNIAYNDLARRAGVSPSTVYSMMDDGRRDLSVITVKKLCDGLDMGLGEFLTPPYSIILTKRSNKKGPQGAFFVYTNTNQRMFQS